MTNKRLIVFASGDAKGGGSGFENLVLKSRNDPTINYEIVTVVSNHEHGGVRERADRLGVRFVHMPPPYNAEAYQEIVTDSGAEWVALSGWLKLVKGLHPNRTLNIHPGLLPSYGGKGMFGHHVHEKVLADFHDGLVGSSAVTMHFVTEVYDLGPVFFRHPVPIHSDDDADTLGQRVNELEHAWQPIITSMVVNGDIHWNGEKSSPVQVPDSYNWL
ncbi:MAG: hypothetical protein HKM24_07130 [Gammaproteobacteria bacterium]|nr:hypothetical protein [Gammaproteobacteria bacterium]